jgi:hypothetical protein
LHFFDVVAIVLVVFPLGAFFGIWSEEHLREPLRQAHTNLAKAQREYENSLIYQIAIQKKLIDSYRERYQRPMTLKN